MPDHNPQHSRRPHYHRGRRGPDRRGGERRPQGQPPAENVNRDTLDVEQIMRELRARISERQGVELTNQQIQELAARRLEAILDPRTVSPTLMDQLRRAAGLPAEPATSAPKAEPAFTEASLYDSPSGLGRLFRRLLNPLLRLLLNPQAIIDAFNAQARALEAATARETELRRRQTEWNALHFEILRRLVTDIARSEIDGQQLGHLVESLAAKVDFNERRVRGFEQTQHVARPAGRVETPAAQAPVAGPREPPPPRLDGPPTTPAPSSDGTPSDGSRRRRRRRRGRRSGAGPMRDASGALIAGAVSAAGADQTESIADGDEFGDDDLPENELTGDAAAPPEATQLVTAGESAPEPATPEPVVHVSQDTAAAIEARDVAPAPDPERPPEG